MTFSRKVDTSDLETFAHTLQSSANLYAKFCKDLEVLEAQSRIKTLDKRHSYIPSPSKVRHTHASAACKQMSARLPEIRTLRDKRDMEDAMIASNLQETRAGIKLERIGNKFLFISDDSNAKNETIFPRIYYGGSYENVWHEARWEQDKHVVQEAQIYPLAYKLSQEGLRLRVMDKSTLESEGQIICEQRHIVPQEAIENNVLIQITAHSCKRDLPSILATTKNSINEIKMITNLDLNVSLDDTSPLETFLPYNTRHKRDLATAGALGIFGTIIGGTSYILKSILDTFLGSSKYARKSDLLKIAHHVQDLKINQKELQVVNQKIQTAITRLEQRYEQVVTGITVMNSETETKSLNRYLQAVLTTTLLKYSQALMAAKDRRTHPYALSPLELREISNQMFNIHKIHLDTNTNNVKTGAVIVNNSITFLFDIPIIQQDRFFNFYTISPIPTFQNNTTYIPDIDANNIAISKTGDKYTTLTDREIQQCMNDPPTCNSHKPVSPVSNQALCVISTYTTNSQKCPLQTTTRKLEPFLHFQDTKLFYSVPFDTPVYIKCYKTSDNSEYSEQSTTISGIGQASYRSSCTINLPDGTNYKTPSDTVIHTLQDSPLFDIKVALPHNVKTTIQFPNFTSDQILPTQTDTPTNTNSIIDSFDKYDGTDFLIFMISTFAPIIFMAIAAFCCYPKIKKWVNRKIQTAQATPPLRTHSPKFWFSVDDVNQPDKDSPIIRSTII